MEETKTPSAVSRIIKDAIILFAITLISGLLLGLVNDVTKKPIELNELRETNEAYASVFAQAKYFSEDGKLQTLLEQKNEEFAQSGTYGKTTCEELRAAIGEEGQLLGYVMKFTNGNGYKGDIQMVAGFEPDGTVTGLVVLSHSETAGLGANCESEEFRSQYVGSAAESFTVVKGEAGDDEISAISGATITSRAVTNGINAAKQLIREAAELPLSVGVGEAAEPSETGTPEKTAGEEEAE